MSPSARAFAPIAPQHGTPVVDIEEQPGASTRFGRELPGMKLEDIKITLHDSQLVIRGEKRREEEKKDSTYHRVERVYGQFERAFTLSPCGAVRQDRRDLPRRRARGEYSEGRRGQAARDPDQERQITGIGQAFSAVPLEAAG